MKSIFFLLSLPFLILSCTTNTAKHEVSYSAISVAMNSNPFAEYWFDGQAEISNYTLKQARYGEVHEGEAAMIFVTEPFSKSKQVKLDNGGAAGRDKAEVLKLNMTKKFFTGIYPYSMMMSTFKPIDQAKDRRPLKISTSSQEWCGHTFTQYNLDGNNYDITQFSYFESEGDQKTKIEAVILEDEIWSQIRMNPDILPTGKFKMTPGSMFTRLRHRAFKPLQVTANRTDGEDGMSNYSVTFEDGRQLSINYSTSFPFTIESWTETYKSGFGPSAKTLTTTATLKKRIKLDYWNRHDVSDANYREELGMRAW